MNTSPFSFRTLDAEGSSREGALGGVRFAVKDNVAIEGHPVSCGITPPVCERAASSADVVARLVRHGARLVGSTVMDELALSGSGRSSRGAELTNPRYPDLLVGGSSSGLAVAVASGEADLGIGSDSGGSVRIPAACCGIAGLTSPTHLPRAGILLFDDPLDSPGIMSDTLPLLHRVISLFASDTTPCSPEFLIPSPEDLGALDAPTTELFSECIRRLSDRQLLLSDRPEIPFTAALSARKQIICSSFISFCSHHSIADRSLGEEGRAIAHMGRILPSASIVNANEVRLKVRSLLSSLLSRNRFLLTPSLPTVPPPHSSPLSEQEDLNRFMVISNMAEAPALVFPVKNTKSSYPISLQLIGGNGAEAALIHAGITLQNRLFS